MESSEDAREALVSLNSLLATSSLDVTATMLFVHAVPAWIAEEFASDITALHHSLVAVPLGDQRHQAVARFHLVRLLLALEALVGRPDA